MKVAVAKVEQVFEDHQKLGMCGIAQVMHNPALFVDLPNFRKRRSVFNRGNMFDSVAPAVSNPFGGASGNPFLAPVSLQSHANGAVTPAAAPQPFAPINLQQRIIGGSEASPHSWPWAAQIVSGNITVHCHTQI